MDGKTEEAKPMIRFQRTLERYCRDILDESDYTLAVRTQLIYPSGSQTTVDGHPHRWQIPEALLLLVDMQLWGLREAFPQSIEVIRRPEGGFPLLYFLRQDVEDELLRRLTKDILSGLGGILPVDSLNQAERVAIKDFISAPKPRDRSIEVVQALCPDNLGIRQTVYLLRGLLVNRILMMSLKKRWNVQYGLHPNRDPISVPFTAKGVPSEQSEWGHADVAILFTCLSFYYAGINILQLRQCLEHLLKSDDPVTEYDRWTSTNESLPPSLKVWNAINVDDEGQLKEIWIALRYSVSVIDYYLNNFVFPRNAKQFRVKLQSNGWDIPLCPNEQPAKGMQINATRKSLTTGFSGTNDNRTMLPLNIKQADLAGLSHTNAEVLTYLLHQGSRECHVIIRQPNTPCETSLLWMLRSQGIRILIDSGAQVLEMDNLTLVKTWLSIDHGPRAALYFEESSNRPWIYARETGMSTPLLASSFADDLSQCIVYLDEVCRVSDMWSGTD